jgi:predicted naringenin-chalcone synthase
MGCYAAMTSARMAREIVLAEASAVVLVVNIELCSLHLQQTTAIDRLVSYCLFADGAAASLVTSEARGLRLEGAYSALSLADADRMAWVVEDRGFAMTLDARVPGKIRNFIQRHPEQIGRCAEATPDDLWAIHPGGRLILDAIAEAYQLTEAQMTPSRSVLRDFGNMSSASVMFVLARLMDDPLSRGKSGHALAFGPGLTVEGIDFTVMA